MIRRRLGLLAAATFCSLGCTIQIPGNLLTGLPRPVQTTNVVAVPSELPVPTEIQQRPSPQPPTPAPGRTALPQPQASPIPKETRAPSTPRPSTAFNQDDPVPADAPMPDSARVDLNYVSSLAVDSKGRLYIMEEYGARVWRRDPDGELTLVLGLRESKPESEEVEPANPTGQPGTAVQMTGPQSVAVDAFDRLLVVDRNRVLRLEEDGTVTLVGDGLSGSGGYVMAGDGEDVWVAECYTWDTNYRLFRMAAGQPPEMIARVELGPDTHLWGAGRDGQGRLIGRLHASGITQQAGRKGIFVLDPETGKPSPLEGVPANEEGGVDGAGRVFLRDAQGWTAYIDGEATRLDGFAPETEHITYDPNSGMAFSSNYYQVFATDRGGKKRAIAGTGKRIE